MISLTEKAARKALDLAEAAGVPPILRVSVRGGGCAGMSYHHDFEKIVRDTDHVWEFFGLKVVCDPKSFEYLTGTEVDYDTNLLKGGFRFNNPQAKRSCSCGESFTF